MISVVVVGGGCIYIYIFQREKKIMEIKGEKLTIYNFFFIENKTFKNQSNLIKECN